MIAHFSGKNKCSYYLFSVFDLGICLQKNLDANLDAIFISSLQKKVPPGLNLLPQDQ